MRTRDAAAMTARRRRVVRGGLATGVGVLLAAVSHTVGGAAPPDAAVVLAAALLAWPVAVLLSARRLRLVGVATGALTAQATLHALFAVTGTRTAETTAHHHGSVALGPVAPALLPDGGMLLSHLVAAVAAFVILGFGDRALRAVSDGIRLALRRVAALPRPATPARRPRPGSRRIRPITARWARTPRRRGPPRLLAAR